MKHISPRISEIIKELSFFLFYFYCLRAVGRILRLGGRPRRERVCVCVCRSEGEDSSVLETTW